MVKGINKPGLKFNPRLALISSLQTTGPRRRMSKDFSVPLQFFPRPLTDQFQNGRRISYSHCVIISKRLLNPAISLPHFSGVLSAKFCVKVEGQFHRRWSCFVFVLLALEALVWQLLVILQVRWIFSTCLCSSKLLRWEERGSSMKTLVQTNAVFPFTLVCTETSGKKVINFSFMLNLWICFITHRPVKVRCFNLHSALG